MNISSKLLIQTAPQTCRSKLSVSLLNISKRSPQKRGCCSTEDSHQTLYDKGCCGHMSRSHYNTFIKDLETEMRKLDSNISLKCEEQTVLARVLLGVRNCVEYILMVQSQFTHMDWTDLETFKSALKAQETKIKYESEKLRITSKNLEQYDSLLKDKDQQIQNDEINLKKRIEMLELESFQHDELKIRCIQLEQELRNMRREASAGKLDASFCKDQEKSLEYDFLKTENLSLKELLSQKLYELENADDTNSLRCQKINLEQEKLQLAQNRYAFEQEKIRFKRLQADSDRKQFQFPEHFENSSSESPSFIQTDRPHNLEFRSKELDYREFMFLQFEKEFTDSLVLIKSLIEEYSKELEVREIRLNNDSVRISAQDKSINERLIDLKLIEAGLQSSRQELDDLYSNIFPSLEVYSQAISQLLADLYLKKKETEEELTKLYNIIEITEIHEASLVDDEKYTFRSSGDHLAIVRENELNITACENCYERSFETIEFKDEVVKMSKHLEEKLEEVVAKDKLLESYKQEIQKSQDENEKVAMQLKISYLELENEKSRQTEKNSAKKIKLREIKQKLNDQCKVLSQKEAGFKLKCEAFEKNKVLVSHILI